jgi:hypothetical protein
VSARSIAPPLGAAECTETQLLADIVLIARQVPRELMDLAADQDRKAAEATKASRP